MNAERLALMRKVSAPTPLPPRDDQWGVIKELLAPEQVSAIERRYGITDKSFISRIYVSFNDYVIVSAEKDGFGGWEIHA